MTGNEILNILQANPDLPLRIPLIAPREREIDTALPDSLGPFFEKAPGLHLLEVTRHSLVEIAQEYGAADTGLLVALFPLTAIYVTVQPERGAFTQ